jgi:hypothetical protein
MYYTGIDPFTKKEVHIAKALRDRKMQRALLQFFKPENYFEVREALRQAGRMDLIGDGCDSLIPSKPPKEALIKRRDDANKNFPGNYVHQAPGSGARNEGTKPGRKPNPVNNQQPAASRPLRKKDKTSRYQPGKGYRPDIKR